MSNKKQRGMNLTLSKAGILFLLLWLHITVLDLFIVVRDGPRFFFSQSLQFETILTHMIIAAFSVVCFYLINQIIRYLDKQN